MGLLMVSPSKISIMPLEMTQRRQFKQTQTLSHLTEFMTRSFNNYFKLFVGSSPEYPETLEPMVPIAETDINNETYNTHQNYFLLFTHKQYTN